MSAPRSKQRFILIWSCIVIVVVMAGLYAFTVINQRDDLAAREAVINAQIATSIAKADPAPQFIPGHYYP